MKHYKVIVSWNDGKEHNQVAGYFYSLSSAIKKQRDVVNQIPLSALEEHITISIKEINHRINS